MSPADLSSEATAEHTPDSLVEAGTYSDYTDAFQHSIVVLAMHESCWLVPDGERHRLLVEPRVVDAAREQLARFDRESLHWPPPPIADPATARRAEILTPLLWSAVVLAVFWFQRQHPDWTRLGALDPDAIFTRGEVWRLATALFLHGNAAHVISNALSGILVFVAWLTTAGVRRGSLLLGLASVAGNLVVAAANVGRDYRSLGASTALFAALGLLTGRAISLVVRAKRPGRWRALFLPLATGIVVLGLYGAGGQNVDVPAHLTGFLSGVVLGSIAGLPRFSTGAPATRSRQTLAD